MIKHVDEVLIISGAKIFIKRVKKKNVNNNSLEMIPISIIFV